ncbi:MAG: hypothetical protein DMG69_24485 [Acidobacteria bacterium]|nr:MAG: hypothetical protein DMG69_24485 [Acidobacteriota bacterium]
MHLVTVNALYTKVVGRRLRLNPLAVTVALLLWAWIWGSVGLILAVPHCGSDQDHLRPRGFTPRAGRLDRRVSRSVKCF